VLPVSLDRPRVPCSLAHSEHSALVELLLVNFVPLVTVLSVPILPVSVRVDAHLVRLDRSPLFPVRLLALWPVLDPLSPTRVPRLKPCALQAATRT
jgi:hypothetical protein